VASFCPQDPEQAIPPPITKVPDAHAMPDTDPSITRSRFLHGQALGEHKNAPRQPAISLIFSLSWDDSVELTRHALEAARRQFVAYVQAGAAWDPSALEEMYAPFRTAASAPSTA